MKDKLDVKTTALALATTSAVVYLACVLLILVFGTSGVSFFARMFHGIDLMKIVAINISLADTVLGFVGLTVSALLVGMLFAKVYNTFAGKDK